MSIAESVILCDCLGMDASDFNTGPMTEALRAARLAGEAGEVPVGAVITRKGEVIASAANRMESDCDATAHAEMLVLREAMGKLGTVRLNDCDLWVTLEPCAMCAAAISHARIARLYYGAGDPKSGGVEHGARVFSHPTCHHAPEIYSGINAEASAKLLRDFFAARR